MNYKLMFIQFNLIFIDYRNMHCYPPPPPKKNFEGKNI